ncbi:PadR family transcriptional regulator [Candidatus Micrarchaeota archaeon]|nr:PadR family transcriptional regulator [Candidatus Micrarchaeota archaeon]
MSVNKHKMEDLGVLQMQILWLLEQGSTHGYDLMKKLSAIKTTKIEQGTLYPALQKLEDNEYIRMKETGERGRKIYELTSTGRAIMRKSCEDFALTFEGIFQDYRCKNCGMKNCGAEK